MSNERSSTGRLFHARGPHGQQNYAVPQEDCSTHEVDGRQNCDHRSLSKWTKQSKDQIGQIADDDDRCKLTPAYSRSVSIVEPCRGGT